MKKLKLITVILVCLVLTAALISCGDTGNDITNEPDNTAVDMQSLDDTEEPAKDDRILPDLPDGLDYGGYVFTFLAHHEPGIGNWVSEDPREVTAEALTGEPINDAVYERNSILKEKYNIDFNMFTFQEERSELRKAVNAGDNIYDAVIIFNNNIGAVVADSVLINIAHLPHIDVSKPWWDPGVNALSIDNKNYLLGGDMLILDNEATNAMLFNKVLMADLGLDLPYSLVREGKWTMDKLHEYITGASMDLNGDGQMTHFEDRFGLIVFNDTLQAFLVAGGGAFAFKDENDLPYMSFTGSRSLSILDKVMDIQYNKQYVMNVMDLPFSPERWDSAYYGTFSENRALFTWARMRVTEMHRGMEADFGIIPMPKYDEVQETYYSLVNPYTGVLVGVPKTADDLERTSVILEAMAAESRYTLQPAYYDITLQRKYTRDDDSSDMLDLIFSTRVYDIGGMYDFGGIFGGFSGLSANTDRNIQSYYDRNIGRMERDIEKITSIFQSMD